MDSKALKELRISLNMSQGQMACMLGIPRITYERWERRSIGNSMGRILELLRIPENRDLMMELALDEAKVKSEAE